MKIWIGYDPREDIAAEVCEYSILKHHPNADVRYLSLDHPKVVEVYERTYTTEHGQMIDDVDHRPFSTQFAFSRFLVPYLEDHKGWALFCDCDFLFLDDPRKLMQYADDEYAVCVVKHNHVPRETTKMDGQAQTAYRRKNWSSLVLWNCGHPENARIGPDMVNKYLGGFLHRFGWLRDSRIGEIPESWNWLEGSSPTTIGGTRIKRPKARHYTLGGPWFDNLDPTDGWVDWQAMRKEMNARDQA